MRVAVLVALALAPGCRQVFGIDDTTVPSDGAAPADAPVIADAPPIDAQLPDAPPGTPDAAQVLDVAHVGAADEADLMATFDLVITVPTTIDTQNGSITPSPGFDATTVAQDGGGPQISLLDLRSLTVQSQLVVIGQRPLVIVADSISIAANGLIDASATGSTPGPNGGGSSTGAAAGNDSATAGSNDSGGGGGGFGSIGGSGGTAGPAAGGMGGGMTGVPELIVLEGGSGGGAQSRCTGQVPGGAGGGALQLTARTTLRIDGIVTASGGGGAGGIDCGGSFAGGGGGGSGGALYFQAGAIVGIGIATANGGGGGGGGTTNGGDADGIPGNDGGTTIAAALGGLGGGTSGWDGANGAALGAAAATAPSFPSVANCGGGGGGVGRIVTRAVTIDSSLVTSPAAQTVAP